MAARFLTSLVAATTLAMLVPAQREEVSIPGQKPGNVTVEYGVVIVGTHGLHELAVGNSWRMGQGNPSTLTTELPLLAGDKLLAPGGYGVNLYRAGDKDLRLSVTADGGGGRGGGRGGGQEAGFQFPGELSELKKKTKKLQLAWLKSVPKKSTEDAKGDSSDAKATDADADKSKGLKTCCLRVDFGPHRVDIPVTVVGATSHRVKSFTGLAFTYPLKLFKDRLASGDTPVFSLIPKKVKQGEVPGFNVMVGEKAVLLAPMAKAPEGRGGFGGPGGGRGGGRGRGGRGDGPDDKGKDDEPKEIEGTVEWAAAQEQCDHVLIKAVKVVKKELQFEICLDDRVGKVKVALPDTKKK